MGTTKGGVREAMAEWQGCPRQWGGHSDTEAGMGAWRTKVLQREKSPMPQDLGSDAAVEPNMAGVTTVKALLAVLL